MNVSGASTSSSGGSGPTLLVGRRAHDRARARHPWVYHPWVKTVFMVCLFALISGFVAYTVIRLRVTFALEQQVAAEHAAVQRLQGSVDALERMIVERFDLLEQAVWGDLDPKLKAALAQEAAKVRPEAWSANRDRELRTRINRLEQRLLLLEGRD